MSTKFCVNCKHNIREENYNHYLKKVFYKYTCKNPTVRQSTKEYLVDGYGLEMLCVYARTDIPLEGEISIPSSACGANGNLYEAK